MAMSCAPPSLCLHATLEDVPRPVLEARWRGATDPALFRRVPFVLPADDRRPEKLGVGELARQMRGKSVEEVVRDAVHGYLEHSSFGDVDDVVLTLARARIEGSGERSNRGRRGRVGCSGGS